MKNKKIHIAILNQGSIRTENTNLMLELAGDTRYDVTISFPANKPISYNRNLLVKRFLETDADFLLMIDDDCVGDKRILDLADYDKDIIGATCFGYVKQMVIPFCMKRNKEGTYDILQVQNNSGVVECDGIGSGLMMIKREVLENMPYPFRNEYDPEGLKIKGLDFNFCERAQKKGYTIWCDTNQLISHWTVMDLKGIWQTINEGQKNVTRAYKQGLAEGLKKQNEKTKTKKADSN